MTSSHNFSPAIPVHTYERIVEQIEQAILSGEIPVGSKLASERELMVQFNVSRPTIREALRVLQSIGLLESRPGSRGGPEVIAPSAKTLGRSFRMMLRTDSLSLEELVQFRIVLEGSACSLAAQAHSAEHLALMEKAIQRMEKAAEENASDFAQADLDFHEAVWQASANDILRMSGHAVSGVLVTLIQSDTEDKHSDNIIKLESARIDRSIFEAIKRRDDREAGQLARNAVATRYSPYLTAKGRESLTVLIPLSERETR